MYVAKKDIRNLIRSMAERIKPGWGQISPKFHTFRAKLGLALNYHKEHPLGNNVEFPELTPIPNDPSLLWHYS